MTKTMRPADNPRYVILQLHFSCRGAQRPAWFVSFNGGLRHTANKHEAHCFDAKDSFLGAVEDRLLRMGFKPERWARGR